VTARSRWWPAALLLVTWAVLIFLLYAQTPLATRIPIAVPLATFLWLVITAIVTLVAVILLLVRRRFAAAALVVLLGAGGAVAVGTIPWSDTYVDSQVALNREVLRTLAADFTAGRVAEGTSLPARLRGLSRDGTAHVREGTLYLATWEDWRAEDGAGLAWFRAPPAAGLLILTAAGDMGRPRRSVGDGWWWIA
jgi:hypothetical protein